VTQSGQRQKKCEFYTPVLIELTVETETPRHAAATLSGVQAMAVLDRSSKSTSHTHLPIPYVAGSHSLQFPTGPE
jgi:hypothetical protein